jgi:hypothetical protein
VEAERLFSFLHDCRQHVSAIAIGAFVEVTGPDIWHQGKSGIVKSITNGVAAIELVKTTDEWLTPTGEVIEVNAGLITIVPTPTELRRAKRYYREQHIANLQPPKVRTDSNIRRYKRN